MGYMNKCIYDFDYDECLSLICPYLSVCLNYYLLETEMAKRSDMFNKLIGNYELFD
jgi:hypothetical protein